MKKIITLTSLLLAIGCSTYKDVRPGKEGIHSITTLGENVNGTESSAYKQANAFCHDQDKKAEFLSDETFKATANELDVDSKESKKKESVATDVSFRCI